MQFKRDGSLVFFRITTTVSNPERLLAAYSYGALSAIRIPAALILMVSGSVLMLIALVILWRKREPTGF
jgi:putative Ca2+/H+ antiporter (TMEM165/GDT1 family)